MGELKRDSEKKSKTKKRMSNLPKWTQWIKLFIDSIILIVSIIAILFTKSTLHEIKIQRIKSFEPELRLFRADFRMNCEIRNISNPESSYDFSIYTYNSNFDSTILFINPITKESFVPWYNSNKFKMPVINVGQSASLDIETTFEIDTNYFVDFFNRYLNKIDSTANFFVKENMFAIKHQQDTIFFRDLVKPSNSFQYMPQYTSNQDTFFIYLPVTYFKLLAMRSLICSSINNVDENYNGVSIAEHHNDLPSIIVNFKYKDINGIRYSSASKCYFNGCGITIGIGEKQKSINYSGDLDVKYLLKTVIE